WVGEVHPRVLAAFDISQRVAWLEVDLGTLFELPHGARPYQRVSRFPSSDIDLAFEAVDELPASAVEDALRAGAGHLLVRLVLLAGPGFFLPLEQEVSRALAARRALGTGTGPVVRRAALFGALICAVLIGGTLIASPLVVSKLFDHDWLLLVGLVLGMAGYYVELLARGTYSGLGRFGPYSVVIGAEGLVRFLICAGLAIAGVTY